MLKIESSVLTSSEAVHAEAVRGCAIYNKDPVKLSQTRTQTRTNPVLGIQYDEPCGGLFCKPVEGKGFLGILDIKDTHIYACR